MKILESHVSPWKIDDGDSFLHALEYAVFEGQDIRILQANQKGMDLENHKREGGLENHKREEGGGGGRVGESLAWQKKASVSAMEMYRKRSLNVEVNPSLEGLKDFSARYAIFRSLNSM